MTTRHENQKCWAVPWAQQTDWAKIVQFTENICQGLGESRIKVMDHIDDILTTYENIEESLSRLCEATCPTCEDVCCTKATVWYDQRDLIVYHLVTGFFPEKQVSRSKSGACCHLGRNGCRLPRVERPFICTWYICTAQVQILRKEMCAPDKNIQEQIHKIKETRKRIATLTAHNTHFHRSL